MSLPNQASAVGALGTWVVLPPAGLTSTGRIRQFQDRTVQRFTEIAHSVAQPVFEQLKSIVAGTYQEGTGELLRSLQYQVNATRDGVEINFMAGTRHLVYLTALAGEPTVSIGHMIPFGGAQAGGRKLRFFWKNPTDGRSAGVYTMRQVFWRPRDIAARGGRDVIGDVLGAGARRFQQEMIRAHDQALVQFVQENATPSTRSPRVSIFSENQIGSQ